MAETTPEDGDPIADEARRAREDRDRSLLPSNDGLGPGAGETPAADVSAGASDREDAAPDVTSTPSLGAPPRRTDRPDFRSSQLDGAPDEDEED
ncbi:MAG: hypothetical protein JF886_12390 [Candidatus Dormibacteraeota bacterium]|uniref:Uncharacterized protein n=1 Tax=Candidatus Aeolococcus gillhamiae TaxID=3127015 RepID=A0A2W6AED2_9BACT|nr:hypothetical protein [Candidatus Dormibacteraeota bacterium]PZR83608.1 MAG: hypothetical protein DLM65_01530 [Candidatus Dormibacter sp. RRmetagenome_bin12]